MEMEAVQKIVTMAHDNLIEAHLRQDAGLIREAQRNMAELATSARGQAYPLRLLSRYRQECLNG